MAKTIRIGTRDSKLALWQGHWVGQQLRKVGLDYELVAITSKGDQILDRSLSKIGSKGVFTEELEEMLRKGEIHIAQHSAKDLPSSLPEDLELIAFSEREKAHDVLLSIDPEFNIHSTKPMIIGTSSTRRRAFMKHFFPQHELVDMRGNLQTRLEKLKNRNCHAMLLAFAGVHRMEMEQYIVAHLPIHQFTPAVGQGSVAVQCATHLDKELKSLVRNACNHIETEKCMLAERKMLAILDGGCSVPVYGHAWIENEEIYLKGGVLSLEGDQHLHFEQKNTEPLALGRDVAAALIEAGANEMLQKIKANLQK